MGNATFHGLESRTEPSAQKTSWVDPGPRFRIPGLETASPVEPAPPPSTLSALIRRRDGVTPVSASVSAATPEPCGPTVIDPQRVLTVPPGGGARPARTKRAIPAARALPPWINPNAPWTKGKPPAELPPSRPVKRRQLTVRLEPALYEQVKAHAARSGATLQAILAGAVGAAIGQSA